MKSYEDPDKSAPKQECSLIWIFIDFQRPILSGSNQYVQFIVL